MWVDETGSDACTHIRWFGIPPVYTQTLAHGKRMSAIPAISSGGLLGVEVTYEMVTTLPVPSGKSLLYSAHLPTHIHTCSLVPRPSLHYLLIIFIVAAAACVSPTSQASGGGFSWSVELIDKKEQVTGMCVYACACLYADLPLSSEALAGSSPASLVQASQLPPLPRLAPL